MEEITVLAVSLAHTLFTLCLLLLAPLGPLEWLLLEAKSLIHFLAAAPSMEPTYPAVSQSVSVC